MSEPIDWELIESDDTGTHFGPGTAGELVQHKGRGEDCSFCEDGSEQWEEDEGCVNWWARCMEELDLDADPDPADARTDDEGVPMIRLHIAFHSSISAEERAEFRADLSRRLSARHFIYCNVYEGYHCTCSSPAGTYSGDRPGPDRPTT